MSHSRGESWGRYDEEAVAVDTLLDAAGEVFSQDGVARASMVDIARRAGCSRATLYRYFPNRDALHHAYVHRATLRIATALAATRGPDLPPDPASMRDRIVAGIRAVRADPLLAVWFEPENMAVPLAVSQDSAVLRPMAAAFIGEMGAAGLDDDELVRRGGWLLRCIVSLLSVPAVDEAEEVRLVGSFVVPTLIADPSPERSRPRPPRRSGPGDRRHCKTK